MDAAVGALIDRCVGVLRERLGTRLVGVVLTGSFARGEGTVVATNGHRRVLGDIEMLVVLPHARDDRALRGELARWAREASATLGDGRLVVDLEFGPVPEAYFARAARPSIFVHDLRTHGRVLCGPPDLLRRIPAFGTEQIPREDAVHLLFNRTIEQLDAWDRVETLEGDALLDVAYQRHKLVLDLAGSALAFVGDHVAAYGERPRAFAALLERSPTLAAIMPPDFVGDLEHAARVKLAPTAGDVLPIGPPDAQRKWIRTEIVAAIPALTALLRWELSVLLGGDAPLPALLERWIAAPSWRARARGWAKLALHPMPAPLPIDTLRALALVRRSTPRALVYAAAALTYLALSDDGPPCGATARLLPLEGPPPSSAAAERAAIVAFWRWCIRND